MPVNEPLTRQIRDQARQLLENGQVDCVIGYEASPRGGARPAFIYDPAEADRLIWDTTCVHNLVTYLHDKKKARRRGEEPPRVAVVVKPCDSRAINVLLAERQIERERIFIIGVACNLWMAAPTPGPSPNSGRGESFPPKVGGDRGGAGEPPARCTRCTERVPVVYDVLLGDTPSPSQGEGRGEGDDLARGEGDDLARGEGDDLGRGEGDDLARGEGDDLARGEGDDLARGEGDDLARGEGDDLARGEGDDLGRGEGDDLGRVEELSSAERLAFWLRARV